MMYQDFFGGRAGGRLRSGELELGTGCCGSACRSSTRGILMISLTRVQRTELFLHLREKRSMLSCLIIYACIYLCKDVSKCHPHLLLIPTNAHPVIQTFATQHLSVSYIGKICKSNASCTSAQKKVSKHEKLRSHEQHGKWHQKEKGG
jgi:hypothetical protein